MDGVLFLPRAAAASLSLRGPAAFTQTDAFEASGYLSRRKGSYPGRPTLLTMLDFPLPR
jgi:hypothetical protein